MAQQKDPQPGDAKKSNGTEEDSAPQVVRDNRALIVALSGLFTLLAIAVTAFVLFPGNVPKTSTNSKGENIVAVASAALTAVGTLVSAYLGVKAANVAREDSDKASQRHEIRTAVLAGQLEPERSADANRTVTSQIKTLVP